MPLPALALLKSKSLYKYGMIAVILVSLILGAYFKGREDVNKKWNTEKVRLETKIEELEARGEKVTIKIETKVVEKIKEVKVKGDTVTEYVYVNLPNDVGPTLPIQDAGGAKYVYRLPKNFIALHNFSALGIVPAEDDPTIKDIEMSEVQLNQVLGIITQNYTTCRAIEAQRNGWQEWYKEQKALQEEVMER